VAEEPTNQVRIRGVTWTFHLVNGNAPERQTLEQLKRVLNAYDVTRWTQTTIVRIESFVIPHSHPVLTLNTRYLDRDDLLLATFLHEEIHWFLEKHQDAVLSAVTALRQIYPVTPTAPPEGARTEISTYLHLIVNSLEYLALRELLGDKAATGVIRHLATHHYQWIYARVLADIERLKGVLEQYHLIIH